MMSTFDEPRNVNTFPAPLPIKGIRKEVSDRFKVQYSFGDFVLNSTRVLFHKDRKISVSPKELAVLVQLLESAGEVVTKDQLIQEVWSGGNVSEESLTRCIYVLRRILQEGKHNRFIDTVYGKGYRFVLPVTRVTRGDPVEQNDARCVFAVLPFTFASPLDALSLHDAIVQEMASCDGLQVLPSSMTLRCRSIQSTLDLLEKIRADFYLTGYELTQGGQPLLRIELIRARDHAVLHREGIALDADHSIESLSGMFKPMLIQHLPCLQKGANHSANAPVEQSAQLRLREGHNALLDYTPKSLFKAVALFESCRQEMPEDDMLLCHLAECYFAMGHLGVLDLEQALLKTGAHVDQVLARSPDNPLALALGGVLRGLGGEKLQAAEMFRRALILSRDNASVQCYYAWYLFIIGEIKRALFFARQALDIRSDMPAALIQILWMEYCNGNAPAALKVKEFPAGAVLAHPVILSMKAVILCGEGQPQRAMALIEQLGGGSEREGLVYFNSLYTRLFAQSPAAKMERIGEIMRQPALAMPSALLPIIMQSHGAGQAKKWHRQLRDAASPCLMLWRHDPRIRSLFSAKEIV